VYVCCGGFDIWTYFTFFAKSDVSSKVYRIHLRAVYKRFGRFGVLARYLEASANVEGSLRS